MEIILYFCDLNRYDRISKLAVILTYKDSKGSVHLGGGRRKLDFDSTPSCFQRKYIRTTVHHSMERNSLVMEKYKIVAILLFNVRYNSKDPKLEQSGKSINVLTHLA